MDDNNILGEDFMYSDYKVLVVEDVEETLKGLMNAIKKLGVIVEGTGDPIAAMNMIRMKEYNVVVMDLNMPPVERTYDSAVGFELLEEIEERYDDTFCIIHSVYQNTAPVSEKANGLARYYVQKSGIQGRESIDKICKKIQNRINRWEKKIEDKGWIMIADVSCHLSSGIIKIGDNTETLTKLERRIVELLWNNKGTPCTFAEIIQAATGETIDCIDDLYSWEQKVRTDVYRIRDKFKKISSDYTTNKYICGIRNVGYIIK